MREERIRRAAIFGILCCLFLGSTQAQEVKLFKFSDFAGALISEYQMTEEKLDSSGIVSYANTRKLLQAGIQLDTAGSLYHPNLLTFRVKINLVGLNSHRRSFTDASVNNDLNNSYNVKLVLLKKKVLSLELFALRQFSTVDRIFLERYFATTRSSGFSVHSKTKFLPFRLNVYKRDILSESEIFKERDEKTKNIDFRSELIETPRSKSSLSLRWKDYSEAVYDIDYKSLEVMTNFLHSYGSNQSNRLSSLLSFNRLSGDYDIEHFQFMTNSLQYILPEFFLNGTYSFNWENSFDRSSRRHRLSCALNHRLYQSLTSSFQLGGKFEDLTFQRIKGLHYQVSADYSKKIPTGRVQFHYRARQDNNNFFSLEGIINTSEAFDFSLSDTFILSRPGLDADSIRITDADFSYVFLEGVDYQIDIISNTVVIFRLPGGAIRRGTELLIHYDYLTYPDHRLKTRFARLFFQLIFLKYFHIYYIRGSNKNTVLSDYVLPLYESYNMRQAGVKYDGRFLSMEYSMEKRKSNLTDYRSWNFRASTGIQILRTVNLYGYLILNRLEYQPETFSSSYNARSLECSFIPGNNLRSALIYRRIKYSTHIYSRVREGLVFKFQWQIRKIILNFFYEHIFNRTENMVRLRDFFSVTVRRNF